VNMHRHTFIRSYHAHNCIKNKPPHCLKDHLYVNNYYQLCQQTLPICWLVREMEHLTHGCKAPTTDVHRPGHENIQQKAYHM